MLISLSKSSSQILKLIRHTPRFCYQIWSAEEYLINRRDCNAASKMHEKDLYPLPGANHGESNADTIALCGMPLGSIKEKFESYDTLAQLMTVNSPDLLFLQLDPCKYIARQRFLSHKCALKSEEDYHESGVDCIDPIKPYSWEECVVNLVILDMLRENTTHSKVNYRKGFSTYAYPFHRENEESNKQLTEPFIEYIKRHLLSRELSPYLTITQTLFSGLMGKHKVLLGGMPEPLLRHIVGNRLRVEEMRDLFRLVIGKAGELIEPANSFRELTMNFLPHIFQAPADLYMTAVLKEAFQASTSIVAMVGIHHFSPIIEYWEPPPHGINYTEATRVPERIRGETEEEAIEKHAIMDVMLSSQVWSEAYISNAFPYIIPDLSTVDEQTYTGYKKCFAFNYSKYMAYSARGSRLLLEAEQVRKVKALIHS